MKVKGGEARLCCICILIMYGYLCFPLSRKVAAEVDLSECAAYGQVSKQISPEAESSPTEAVYETVY